MLIAQSIHTNATNNEVGTMLNIQKEKYRQTLKIKGRDNRKS